MIADNSHFASQRTKVSAALAILICLLLTVKAAGASDSEPARDAARFMRLFADQAIAVLSDKDISAEQHRHEFYRLLSSKFAIGPIGRFAMGKHWHRATKQERLDFARLFKTFIVVTYARRLEAFSGETLKLGATRYDGKIGLATLSSRIIRPAKSPVRVDWRLRNFDGAWKIVDVVVEGVSLVTALRSEFYAVIIEAGGRIEGLLDKLRERIMNLDPAVGQEAAKSF